MDGRVLLIGGGGHALVVADAAARAGLTIVGFVDDDSEAPLSRLPEPRARHLGALSEIESILARGGVLPHLAIGDVGTRRRVVARLGVLAEGAATIVHPSACVASSVVVGAGVFVGPRAVVNAGSALGAHCIVNSGAIVEHECLVGAGAHVAPGAVLAGRVRVGEDALVGMGARVLPGVSVGERCVVGAGAVVTRPVERGDRVAGVPARAI